MRLSELVLLFDVNDKSNLTVMKYVKNENGGSYKVLFDNRVDYLQFDENGELHPLCEELVESIEVGVETLFVYLK